MGYGGILRACTTQSLISYIVSFCIASCFHKRDQRNRQENMATTKFNLNQIASSIFEKLFQEQTINKCCKVFIILNIN